MDNETFKKFYEMVDLRIPNVGEKYAHTTKSGKVVVLGCSCRHDSNKPIVRVCNLSEEQEALASVLASYSSNHLAWCAVRQTLEVAFGTDVLKVISDRADEILRGEV